MKRIIFLCAFLLSFSLFASETVKTKIYKIYEPESGSPDYLILASNGHVYGLPAEQGDLVKEAQEAWERSLPVEVLLQKRTKSQIESDERSTVEDLRIIESGNVYIPFQREEPRGMEIEEFAPEHHIKPLDNFSLSSLSQSNANSLFNWMRNDLRGSSECYNRAHVWSWEIYKNRGLNTGKMFLFFTRKYINEYRYKWWFHVAPYIRSSGQNLVLDRQYFSSPRYERSWTNAFMKNNARCPSLTRYSDYANNEYTNYCYVIPASMYYWQPYNLKNLETGHYQKRSFLQGEINHSYRDARGWFPW